MLVPFQNSPIFNKLQFSPKFLHNCRLVLESKTVQMPRKYFKSTCHKLIGSNATRQLINSAQCQNQGSKNFFTRHITQTESTFSLLAVTDQIHKSSQETQEDLRQTLTQNQSQFRTVPKKASIQPLNSAHRIKTEANS